MPSQSPDASGLEGVVENAPGTTLAASGCPAHYVVVAGDNVELMVFNEPVQYSSGSAILDPSVMKVGLPYPLELEGHTLVVVKRRDGSLDFFAVPEE
jgi:hypothetical protein